MRSKQPSWHALAIIYIILGHSTVCSSLLDNLQHSTGELARLLFDRVEPTRISVNIKRALRLSCPDLVDCAERRN